MESASDESSIVMTAGLRFKMSGEEGGEIVRSSSDISVKKKKKSECLQKLNGFSEKIQPIKSFCNFLQNVL